MSTTPKKLFTLTMTVTGSSIDELFDGFYASSDLLYNDRSLSSIDGSVGKDGHATIQVSGGGRSRRNTKRSTGNRFAVPVPPPPQTETVA